LFLMFSDSDSVSKSNLETAPKTTYISLRVLRLSVTIVLYYNYNTISQI